MATVCPGDHALAGSSNSVVIVMVAVVVVVVVMVVIVIVVVVVAVVVVDFHLQSRLAYSTSPLSLEYIHVRLGR